MREAHREAGNPQELGGQGLNNCHTKNRIGYVVACMEEI